MDTFDLIGALEDYSILKGWLFIYGDNFHRNYELSKQNIAIDGLILGADPFVVSPEYSQYGKLIALNYNGLVMLGRKYEKSTKSSIDETYLQKYTARLKELMQTLSANLITFSCANELTIVSSQFDLSINSLDENVDFVVCSITLRQEL